MTSNLDSTIALPRNGATVVDRDRPTIGSKVDTRRRRAPRGTGLALAALAVAGVGLVAYDRFAGSDAPAYEGAVDTPVAASDLSASSMYHVVDQIGARQLWEQGITGAGVNVAVIDTGVAPVESLSADGKLVAVVDVSPEAGSGATAFVDGNGHGTHLAAIIAGSDPGASAAEGVGRPQDFLGVAPDAGIVSVKVTDRNAEASPASVIAGIEWTIEHAEELDIGVISLAYASGSPLPYELDGLTAALERAWDAGIVVVVAGGNEGAEANGLSSPADHPLVIAVGGTTTGADAAVAEWSSVGDGTRNPDVVAPGQSIESARVPGSVADIDHPQGFVDDATFKGSGTSQSAAVAAGASALLRQANPEWTPDQVKAALTRSATPIAGASAVEAGAGLINVAEAAVADVSDATQSVARSQVLARTPQVAAIESIWNGSSWTGSSWTGSSWTGSSWTGSSWTGSSWTGSSWTGSSWTGSSWTGSSWTGSSWTGSSWTGSSWTGSSWTGSSWTGSSWTGSSWTGSSWTGSSWTGSSWTGSSWTGSSWTGSSWTGSSWT